MNKNCRFGILVLAGQLIVMSGAKGALRHVPVFGRDVARVKEGRTGVYGISADKFIYSKKINQPWRKVYQAKNKIIDFAVWSAGPEEVLIILQNGYVYRLSTESDEPTLSLSAACNYKKKPCSYRLIRPAIEAPDLYMEVVNWEDYRKSRVYHSKNGGLNWLPLSKVTRFPINISENQLVWWSGFYKSLDQGQTWSYMKEGVPPSADQSEAVLAAMGQTLFNPIDKQDVVVWNVGGVYRSFDEGQSFNMLPLSFLVSDISFDGEGNLWLLDENGTLSIIDSTSSNGEERNQIRKVSDVMKKALVKKYRLSFIGSNIWVGPFLSTDKGITFNLENNGLRELAFTKYVCADARCYDVLASTSQELYWGTQRGLLWNEVFGLAQGQKIVDVQTDGHKFYLLIKRDANFSLVRSLTPNFLMENLTEIALPAGEIFSDLSVQPVKSVDLQPIDNELVVYQKNQMYYYRKLSSDQVWERVNVNEKGEIKFFRHHPLMHYKVFMATRKGENTHDGQTGQLFYSKRFPAEWNQLPELPGLRSAFACDLMFHQFNSDLIYLITKDSLGDKLSCSGDLLYAKDGGEHWEYSGVGRDIQLLSSSIERRDDVFFVKNGSIGFMNAYMGDVFQSRTGLAEVGEVRFIVPNLMLLGTQRGLYLLIDDAYDLTDSTAGAQDIRSSSPRLNSSPVANEADSVSKEVSKGCAIGAVSHKESTSGFFLVLIFLLPGLELLFSRRNSYE